MSLRALDHLVLPCADLDAAARWYTEQGFQVGRRNRHPWGTENHIIQFPGVFLELIALASDYVPVPPDDAAFPIAGFLAGQGSSRDPSGMIVLRSSDADADAAAFRARGIGTGRRLDFSRDGVAPDGSTRTVAFSLAFAEAGTMPDIGFFTCQHHRPENFWDPARQRHPNGATGIGTVEIAAAVPGCMTFLSRFLDESPEGPQINLSTYHIGPAALRLTGGAGRPRLNSLTITAASGDIVVILRSTGPSLG